MLKLTVLLAVLCIGISSTKIPLRDPEHWNSWNNFDLLNKYMGGFDFGIKQLQSDSYLNELAQAAAECEGDKNDFIRDYPVQTTDNLLVFGLKLKGDTTYKQIFQEDFNSVMDGMPGFLYYKYKNSSMTIDVRELKELMDVARCDTVSATLDCNAKACENLWRAGTGTFKFTNGPYTHDIKFNNMLKVFELMSGEGKNLFQSELFRNTHSTQKYHNRNFELTIDRKNEFSSPDEDNGEWGFARQFQRLVERGGDVKLVSDTEHQYVKCHLEVNDVFVTPAKTGQKLSFDELKELTHSQIKTLFEMFNRDQVFKSLTKYGEGYALDKDGNINIVFSVSGPVSDKVKPLDKETRFNLFNYAKRWPWLITPPGPATTNTNPFTNIVETWRGALGLSMGPINKDRVKDGLPELKETDSGLTQLAQAAADKWAKAGKFDDVDFSSRHQDTLVVAMNLNADTRIKEYAFLVNEHNFGQITCFDNFSNQKHKIVNIIDNKRYICSKNSQVKNAVENWKKYNIYGTGYAVSKDGDHFMAIALSF